MKPGAFGFMFGSSLVLAALLLSAGAAADPIQTKGTIEAVIVYRGQALVTRVVDVDAPPGPVELAVEELPAQVVPDSLYATGDNQALIRAVRFRSRAVEEEPREDIRKLDAQIEDVQRQLRENQELQKLQATNQQYLANLGQFAAARAREEMERGVLNADTIKSISEFIFEQTSELTKENLRLKEEGETLNQKLSLLQRQRSELAARFPTTTTAREALIFLDKSAETPAEVHLNYLVQEATWSPIYNIRSGDNRQKATLEYNALVRQMSGEDWEGVRLTLSTASPAMAADSPILTPFWVTLTARPQPPVGGISLQEGQQQARMNIQQALGKRRGAAVPDEEALKWDWAANVWADRFQMLDVSGEKEELLAVRPRPTEEALSVNYTLPDKISIASRSDQQMIQIASLALPSDFYYIATPLLTPYVYQHADVANDSEFALLSGSVNSYLDGQFMGSGRIPVVAKGQQFKVGFGVESQLRASRELVNKTDTVQGGNRVLTFRYRLLVENYRDAAVKVRLLDRLPEPRGADIRVTLGDLTDPLSEDEVYLRTFRKMGILRWEIEVPARAAGASAKMVEYEFKMEFDRNLHIGEPEAAEIQKEKEAFQKSL